MHNAKSLDRMFIFGLLALAAWADAAFAETQSANVKNAAAVQEVASGARTEANAAWWGFSAEDATPCLQGAIDSGAAKVTVPYVGMDWIVRPIKLRSNLELVFDPGVVILAKKDEFKGGGDSLFTASDAENVTLRGYGATWRMRKTDYQSKAYKRAEWRMTLDLVGCSQVRVEGLRLESSGGDGIYLGATARQPFCKDVVIRDVVCHDHHRQGISVIGAENLLIENCTLCCTGGTAPQAGIDFEPNRENERLTNCVLRHCTMEDNSGAGILMYLKNLSRKSDPISITVEDCWIRGGKSSAIGVGALKDDGPDGLVEFKNCTIQDSKESGLFLYSKSSKAAAVRFTQCKWSNTPAVDPDRKKVRKAGVPVLISQLHPQLVEQIGGIEFRDCYVFDTVDRPFLKIEAKDEKDRVTGIKADFTVRSPFCARTAVPKHATDMEIKIVPME